MRHFIVFLTVILSCLTAADAFASARQARQFIELINQADKLPASFVADWPTFVLDPSSETLDFCKIPDANGFVVPTSLDELWQPQDLKQPQCLVTLGFHIRNGEFRHVFPAIDLSYNGGKHRNRGLNTVPRAHQWSDFGSLVVMSDGGLDECSLSLAVRRDQEEEWKTLVIVDSITSLVDYAIQALAITDLPKELGNGSCILHVVCPHDNAVTCPMPGNELQALLLKDRDVVGTLQVAIEKTAAGSESEYLPEAYKPLFLDESLQRPAYFEAKRRMAKRASNRNKVE